MVIKLKYKNIYICLKDIVENHLKKNTYKKPKLSLKERKN